MFTVANAITSLVWAIIAFAICLVAQYLGHNAFPGANPIIQIFVGCITIWIVGGVTAVFVKVTITRLREALK
jgi:hypothetical protein